MLVLFCGSWFVICGPWDYGFVGAPTWAMSVSLEKQIKDRHGYVAVFLYMICQGGFILLGLSLRRCR